MDHGTGAAVAVLVVEDEPLLRLDTMDMVEAAGFEVLDAGNAAQAMQILESRPDIRIILSDIHMPPGINGMELVAQARLRWPPIEIILLSGNMPTADVTLPDRGLFFSKPYRPRDVVAALHRLAA